MVFVYSLRDRTEEGLSESRDGQISDAVMLKDQIVNPGEVITIDPGYMRGHGSYGSDETTGLISSLSGKVERVNKLICVEPLKSRYNGEIGDVVIGRVVAVGTKRWQIDTNSRQNSMLALSSISLPGGVLRRKLESDELQMRNYLVEGDAICAEVQMLYSEGSLALHTRSSKYGKLRNGIMISVAPALIKRSKSHIHVFPFGVMTILGLNGYVWVGKPIERMTEKDAADDSSLYSNRNEDISDIEMEHIVRVCCSIEYLANRFIQISEKSILQIYQKSLSCNVSDLPSNMMIN